MDEIVIKALPPDEREQAAGQEQIDIRKYKKLIRKKRYLILAAMIIVAPLWVLFYGMFLDKQEFTSLAKVRFDDPKTSGSFTAMTDFGRMDTFGKIAILETKSFLTRVVDTLYYDLVVDNPNIHPAEFILNATISKDALFGEYKFVRDGKVIRCYFSDEENDIEDQLLRTMHFTADSAIVFNGNGMEIILRQQEFDYEQEISIYHIPDVYAVDYLYQGLSSELDRSRTILTIYYTGAHPVYSAHVVNTVANLFVQQLLEYKRLKTSSILTLLSKQLTAASTELNEAEKTLGVYREKNPLVTLAGNRQESVRQIAGYESQLRTGSQARKTMEQLIQKRAGVSGFDDTYFLYQEIQGFLRAEDVAGADMLITQYTSLYTRRQTLLEDNYPPQHPQVISTQIQMQEVQDEADRLLDQYYHNLSSTSSIVQSDMDKLYSTLKRLPRSEMRLAELERNRQIKENIFSNILRHIEEAKISDAAVIPDAYVIDEARPPLIKSDLKKQLTRYAVGPILGLVLGLIFVIGLDILDNSIRSPKEVEKKTDLKVLATIPVILDEKTVPETVSSNGELDPKLITSDYAPNIASESFRFLRTKLSMQPNGKNELLIISISPNEGKSLLAANLAITFAQKKTPTILIDADLRRGLLHRTFNCNKKPGLSDILAGQVPVSPALLDKAIQKTHVPHLFLIPRGFDVPNPSELLAGERMQQLLVLLQREFGWAIIDTPPIEFVPDAIILNAGIHNMLLVARYGKTRLNHLTDKLSEFEQLKKDFCGVVINAARDLDNKDYYYSYYHY